MTLWEFDPLCDNGGNRGERLGHFLWNTIVNYAGHWIIIGLATVCNPYAATNAAWGPCFLRCWLVSLVVATMTWHVADSQLWPVMIISIQLLLHTAFKLNAVYRKWVTVFKALRWFVFKLGTLSLASPRTLRFSPVFRKLHLSFCGNANIFVAPLSIRLFFSRCFHKHFEGFEGSIHKGSHVLCEQFYFSK